jgi:hypothetical protein
MRSILLLWGCCSSLFLFAQKEINYIAPPDIETNDCVLSLQDIVSKKDYCKFRLTIRNNSNQFYAYQNREVGFDYGDAGTYKPKKEKLRIIEPLGKIAFVPRVEGNLDYRHDYFNLNLDGLRQVATIQAVEMPRLGLWEGTSGGNAGVTATVKKATSKNGKLSFSVVLAYKGDAESFVRIKTSDLQVKDDNNMGGIPSIQGKEYRILKNGEDVTINGELNIGLANLGLLFNNSVKLYSLRAVNISPIDISREGSVARKKNVVVQEDNSAPVVTNNNYQAPPATTNTYAAQSCSPVNVGGEGPTKINFYNAERTCFIVYMNGALISQQYTSNLTFRTGPGKKMLELHFQDGRVVSDKIVVYPQYLEAGFRVKPKKQSFVVNLVLGTVVEDPNYVSPLDKNETYSNSNNNTNNNSNFQSSNSYTETRSSTINGRTTTTTTTTRSNTSGDNLNISVGTDTDNLNMSIGETGIGVTTLDGETFGININTGGGATDTRTTTTTTTNINSNQTYDDGYRGRKNCMEPNAGSGYFNDLKNQISDEITDFSKIDVAKQGVRGRCFSADQIVQLTELFSSDSSKLEFAKAAYGSTYDADNYYKVVNLLTFSSNKDELRQYIR